MEHSQREVVEIANRIVNALLLNSSVESFGISHQVPFIEFRNDRAGDVQLYFDSDIKFSSEREVDLSEEERLLVGMNSINLKLITATYCNEFADLQVFFEDGSWFKINGASKDEYEPWQLSNGTSVNDGGTLLIAQSGGGYAIWDGTMET
ncbi:hypothetical protein [Hymenobacter sp. HDW8]|uniref:hypothetical protein n=1 Tax=Hymenobacter sp. HDW8 TaxID=2714932 RepID=UPI001409AB49|nr:hypothetical protein [Hymenobacter sp. HDW8]QIL77147.1 hypothetical protein G7064_15790 [Hymenobacter sp. HDW8]